MAKRFNIDMASPAVQSMKELLDETKIDGSLEGFKFEIDICRKAFDYYDNDKNGSLEVDELFKLADVLWDTFYPQGPKLDESGKGFMVQEILGKTDVNHDSVISFAEFIPWYKAMAQKHWRATHPSQQKQRDAAAAAQQKKMRVPVAAAAPPAPSSAVTALQAPAATALPLLPSKALLGAAPPKSPGRVKKPLPNMKEYYCTLTQQNYWGLACVCSLPGGSQNGMDI